MKEITAIIRPKKMVPTKEALDKLGFPCFMAVQVLGRGKQRGIAAEVNIDPSSELMAKGRSFGMKYIPKRLLTLVVPDTDVDTVVKTIIKVNETAQIGDGKIFISPVEEAIRVRTGEVGDNAIH